MNIVTVDLDDTLIETHSNYVNAKESYAEYLNENFDIEKDTVIDVIEEIDAELFEEMGLSKKRFPTAFIRTAESLLKSKYLKNERVIAQNYGLRAFKSQEEYKNDGFIKNAEEMLDILDEKYDRMHLLTAGVPEVQNPKIEALELKKWFDNIHIVEPNTKKDIINQLRNEYDVTEITHVGNSEHSDIKAAIESDANAVYIPNNQWMGTSNTDYTKVNNVKVFNSISEYINYI